MATPEELVIPLPVEGRSAVLCHPTSTALVLGSSQLEPPRREPGVAVVRRRSGGAAVLVEPGSQCWLDVFVPAGDPLYSADVGRAMWWLGEVWTAALGRVLGNSGPLEVYRGRTLPSRWSRHACFSGLGAGEVTSAGRKVVGICQRRDARGAWLFSMAILSADPARLALLLCEDAGERANLELELARVSAAVPAALAELETALLELL